MDKTLKRIVDLLKEGKKVDFSCKNIPFNYFVDIVNSIKPLPDFPDNLLENFKLTMLWLLNQLEKNV